VNTAARIVLQEAHRKQLEHLLFDAPGVEGAAFLLCGQATGGVVAKLTSHAVVPVAPDDYLAREPDRLSIQSRALMRIAKLAKYEQLSIVFAHSHPFGWPHFSDQDNGEEEKLVPFLQARVPDRLHGTLVMTPDSFAGRVYGPHQMAACVFVVGDRLRMHAAEGAESIPTAFDRQVRAFGREIQTVLSSLNVGIVGVGGTGSPLAEQLLRLGVGHLALFDGDTLDETNVNRVFGSSLAHAGEKKVDIAKQHLDRVGLPTIVEAIPEPITREAAARRLRDCDVVFGCTDKQIPRAILGQLALKYCLPVIDIGVVIDSHDLHIRGVHGRVTTLQPGEACLFCRGRISSEAMRVEALTPVERERRVREGYAPELETPAPAVIAFTSAVASYAVMELLHRLTGYMGKERASSEVLLSFDQSRIRTNRVGPRDDCLCADQAEWARGDEMPFLGMTWSTHST
jgi:molybdopterin/thiamine biosynthesis adenylyltransferase